MTHRLDVQASARHATVLFQGLLDRQALLGLEARCRAERCRGKSVLVRLGPGTTVVEAALIEELVSFEGITLEADSPFLEQWIRSCRETGAS